MNKDSNDNIISSNVIVATLANGLRVVASRTAGLVSYMGILVNAGSSDEDATHHGLAHFVEHTVFKGTLTRKASQIANRMETIGGELNAYTTKEETMIYASAPKGYVARGLELIADLVANASFPVDEIEREREVIIEEIHSYLDSPSEAVFDDFEENIYAGSSLAHNILGTPESVRNLTSEDARGFIERFYTPENMVLYIVDPGKPEDNIRLAERYFGSMQRSFTPHKRTAPAPLSGTFCKTVSKENYQANTIVGTRVFDRRDLRRYPLFLLNNYLGGPSMNSRLNRELRDKRGLVYTVDSNVALLSQSGTFTVYFGTHPESVKKCVRLITKEIEKLAERTLSPTVFERIRRQYCGQLILTTDHIESRSMALAKSYLYFGEIHDPQHTARIMQSVTPEEVRDCARLILDNGLSSYTIS